jgi:predicted transcriptional regulator
MTQEGPRRKLLLSGDIENSQFLNVLKALDSVNRLRILRYLWNKVASVSDIASALDIPASTVSLHIDVLEDAGLVRTGFEPANRGVQKICMRVFDNIMVELPLFDDPVEQIFEQNIPIGSYTAFEAAPTCGLVSQQGVIGVLDEPASFYEVDRSSAQLIWFRQGYLEYHLPNRLPAGAVPETLRLSMEICSEAPHFDMNWPSDITLWINGLEIGCWTSPADFGGEPGRLTPGWWPLHYCQFGLLKEWYVTGTEAGIDGIRLSGLTIADLKLDQANVISFRLGVKPDAKNVGGLNLFGEKFGNHPQGLNFRIFYRQPNQPDPARAAKATLGNS